jgi:staphylococcal nuclease domain-containing protein 1
MTTFNSGNEETTAFSRMRPLDAAFKSLPGQAQEARLSFVQPAALSSDYGLEALDRFKQLSEVSDKPAFVLRCTNMNKLTLILGW